eukprot:gnl/Spiro4/4079_TR2033_c0_g1_i1.p1 gnl/Spiro4/4079_TR2033_c0_g1~~gnl/Spiro4/4079_TR2033_c0_g1_i1.p1  ORF type:complete len:134 (-),score=20.81 gnl/Spiro4/4079_TR2033_c0_g1_i1:71-442(-)
MSVPPPPPPPSRAARVQQALFTNSIAQVFEILLVTPPPETDTMKAENARLMTQALVNHVANAKSLIDRLDPLQSDILMKYIYRGMGESDSAQTSGSLLQWHGLLAEKTGVGSIIRVMTQAHTV